MAKSETLGYTSVLGPKYSDLRRRLVFLLLGLVVYPIGAHIPVPGIDPGQLAQLFQRQQGGIVGLFNMFSGGALSRFTVFALGIMPYISASIVIQLLGMISPHWRRCARKARRANVGSPSTPGTSLWRWQPSRRSASRWRSKTNLAW